MRRAASEATDPVQLARDLAAEGPRTAGSDAECRAAHRLAAELKALGRPAVVEPLWVRPNAAAARALCAVLGIAGSVLSVDGPRLGLGLALAGLLLLLADVVNLPLARRLTRERATQNVVSSARVARKVTLLVTASTDVERRGVLAGLPGPVRFAAAGLVGVCVMATLREGGAEGNGIGAVQLAFTVPLILACGAFLDRATSFGDDRPGTGAGPAAALAVTEALTRTPLRAISVEVVLCGAGEHGMRAHVAKLRAAGVRASEVAVLHVGPCGAGAPRFWTREGALLPLPYHPSLIAAGRAVAAAEGHLGAAPAASATSSPATSARSRNWPAIRVGTKDRSGELDPDALRATVALATAMVRRLDADLVASDPDDRPREDRRRAPLLFSRRSTRA